ncbi:MAG: type I-E CRISPR-associated protein Cas5/CasD [Anaerolineaceae bacterium]|jgi:CRISPR system Cascade subunit CasD|nr:type I-E CRISPR-associated protein Cas5/CasD [Anaerolineaceae bacterium]
MGTLLMRIAAPMQSWGTQSNFTVRDTGLEPSKSGIIGLICAALGRPRSANLADLSELKMGVRIDREGVIKRDFHIVQDVLLGKGKGTKDSIITNRYFLADAVFLVGLEGDNSILTSIQSALKNPVWQLYFGRKAFAPALPVWLNEGLRENYKLEESLFSFPWITEWRQVDMPDFIRLVIEMPDGEQIRNDVPLSFEKRKFVARRVSTRMLASSLIPQELV